MGCMYAQEEARSARTDQSPKGLDSLVSADRDMTSTSTNAMPASTMAANSELNLFQTLLYTSFGRLAPL